MRKGPIQQTIAIGFTMIWVVLTVVIVLALVRMQRVSEQLDAIANQNNIKIALAVEMRDIIYQRQLLMRNSLILGDTFDREANRAKLAILAQQFVTLRDSLMKMDIGEEEQEIIDLMNNDVVVANIKGHELIDLMLFDGLSDQTRELTRVVTDGQNQVIKRLNGLVALETEKIKQAVKVTKTTQTQTSNYLTVLGAIAAALILLIANVVIRNSRRQTERIEHLARFASENPRPVMRIGFDGELIYANPASQIFLDAWETDVGHQVPLEWRKLVEQVEHQQRLLEHELMLGDQVYSVMLIPVEGSNYVNVYGHDVTEREHIRQEFARMASLDSLTGLVNRREFERMLEELIADASSSSGEHAFLYFDLDQFKVVNDTCGHVAGDELLRQLSSVLKENVRGSDMLGRLGGDEFGLLLRSCSLGQAAKIAENLRQLITGFRFAWKGQSFNVGASIGVVAITAETGNQSSVLSAADAACYIAKESGRNQVHVGYPDDELITQRRGQMEWVQRIREAIDLDRFELWSQDIHAIGLTGMPPKCAELLLRFFDENGQLVATETFIQAAERYDLMPSIDRWVIQKALPLIAELEAETGEDEWFSINLSGQSLGDKNFAQFVLDQLEQSGVNPGSVCFEITETAAISNLSMAIEFIGQVRDRGCRIALDDFGSGLSSFSYLQNLKVDYLKIDGAFVSTMHENRVNAAMVEAIAGVARELDIQVIAEWVEHPETIELLKKQRIDYAQGYAFGEILPIDSGRFDKVAVSERFV